MSGASSHRRQPFFPRVCVLTLSSALIACGDGATAPAAVDDAVTTLELSATTVVLDFLGATQRLTATGRTADGRAVATPGVSWSSSEPSVVRVDPDGSATAVAIGRANVTARAGSLTASASVTVRQVPAELAFQTQPATTAAGAEMAPAVEVEVRDAGGSVAVESGDPVTLAIAQGPAGAELSGSLTATPVDGVAAFPGISLDLPGSGYRLEARSSGIPSATSAPFDVTAPEEAPVALAFLMPPAHAEAGVLMPPVKVEVVDRFGNRVTSARIEVELEAQDNRTRGSLEGTTRVEAVGGVATFDALVVEWPGWGFSLLATADGLQEVESDPFDVFVRFRTIDVGRLHSCGISTRDRLYCWGRGNVGQLGLGPDLTGLSTPGPVGGDLRWARVDAGQDLTCGITLDGEAYCWGRNDGGQVGDGTVQRRYAPTPVAGGHAFVDVRTMNNSSCGVTTSGQALCWGLNHTGQLGNGSVDGSITPMPVAGGHHFDRISVGHNHACALTPGNAAYCWGWNQQGQVGSGGNSVYERVPLPVAGGLAFQSVSVSAWNSCGLTPGGEAYCWGYNDHGELGDGSTEPAAAPTAVVGGLTFASIEVGVGNICGLATDQRAFCWGQNLGGELGNGTTGVDSSTPVEVLGGHRFVQVGTGGRHACGLTGGGEVYCWGILQAFNDYQSGRL